MSDTVGLNAPLSLASPDRESGSILYFLSSGGIPGAFNRDVDPVHSARPVGSTANAALPLAHADSDVAPGTQPKAFQASPNPTSTAGSSTPGVDISSLIATNEFRPEVVADLRSSRALFDPRAVKQDFPILRERVHGRPLVWLDNAATTQKPQLVIDRLSHYYEHENSNVHRGAHALAARATDAYEAARATAKRFLNAPSSDEIIFVRGATEAINLVAQSWGRRNVARNDEVVVTWLEHHANIVPWQQLCAAVGARLRVVPVDDRGQVILEEYEKLLSSRTKLVALPHVSNALGTVVPARDMVAMAHRHGARVLVDGAQAVSHMAVDVSALGCDFYCFSGHKVFAPTGIGVLFGRSEVLEDMPPWQGGGNMIEDVTFEKTVVQKPPSRFEAGTGSIGDAAGLGAALDYVMNLGLDNISRYEHELLAYATSELLGVKGLHIIGNAAEKAGVLSFVLDGLRTEDVGSALDKEGIAVRSGHHCAQPILRRFGLESTVRASLAPYNTNEDIDALVAALDRIRAGQPAPPL
jgi:cysteine desulfurase/selenocysteine lyase